MFLSFKWLKEFTPYSGSVDELSECLTMLGLEVEEVLEPFAHLQKVCAGYVQECAQHPQADQLWLCQVQVGRDEPLPVVCGAPNIASGQYVAVALPGAILPGGMEVKKTRIRGVESQGLICSEHELGLGEDQSGILVLKERETLPGQSLLRALDLDEIIFDVAITPNRSDCLSILGLAREIAAFYQIPLHTPGLDYSVTDPSCSSVLGIEIYDPKLCPLYQAKIIHGVEVTQSPDWMRHRLLAMGLRPINNIVDITNYVLLEMGQPLHAFDRSLLEGDKIRVGRAASGQVFVTLDGQERILSDEDLLIMDGKKPVALAGIMGGLNSEINEQSSEVLLESAVFNPGNIRRTAKRMGISSGASYRFERGVDQPGSFKAMERATSLIQRIAGGSVLKGTAKSEPLPYSSPRISFCPEKARDLMSLDLNQDFCSQTLENLGCSVEDKDSQQWTVVPPAHRLDLTREVDLIEEVARFYGFEQIPVHLPRISKSIDRTGVKDQEAQSADYSFLKKIKTWAEGLGFKEVINYSFVGKSDLQALGQQENDFISLQNPLSSDQDTLRTILAPGLLNNLRLNVDQNNYNLRFFEVARVFCYDSDSETKAYENTKLSLLVHGSRYPGFWPWPQEKSDYLDLKGVIEHLSQILSQEEWSFYSENDHPYLQPCVRVNWDSRDIGYMGQLKQDLAKLYHARFPVWLGEFDLDMLHRLYAKRPVLYRPWPKFPPVHRDLTVIAAPEVKFSQIKNIVFQAGVSNLEECFLLDVFQPQQSRERHLTFRMIYRHAQRTLTDKEVDKQHNRLGETLIKSLPLRFP